MITSDTSEETTVGYRSSIFWWEPKVDHCLPISERDHRRLAAYGEIVSSVFEGVSHLEFYPIEQNSDHVAGHWIQTKEGRIMLTIRKVDGCARYCTKLEAEATHNSQSFPVELDEENPIKTMVSVLGEDNFRIC